MIDQYKKMKNFRLVLFLTLIICVGLPKICTETHEHYSSYGAHDNLDDPSADESNFHDHIHSHGPDEPEHSHEHSHSSGSSNWAFQFKMTATDELKTQLPNLISRIIVFPNPHFVPQSASRSIFRPPIA